MKLLVLIFSCKKYLFRLNKLRNIGYFDTFEKKNIHYLIIIGNTNLSEEYILQKNTLTVKVDDTYRGFPYKIIKTFNIINKLYNYDYIIKTDDDCLLNIDKLHDIFDYVKKYDYIGRLNNFKHQYNPNWNGLNNKSKYLGPYMNGATGYVLSKKALETIINYKETNKLLLNEFYEDKLVGDILRLNGYKFIQHRVWSSTGIILMKINNYNQFIKNFNNKSYISFYQYQ